MITIKFKVTSKILNTDMKGTFILIDFVWIDVRQYFM